MSRAVLVRYGAIPEVGKFAHALDEAPQRGEWVVVRTPRGLELGVVLEAVRHHEAGSLVNGPGGDEPLPAGVLRRATDADRVRSAELRGEAQAEFAAWRERIQSWGLELELIDAEWTLDREKLVLYVLSGRGPDTTKLALLAAAQGHAAIEVQPVAADGLAPLPPGGQGCGSGGCGCHE